MITIQPVIEITGTESYEDICCAGSREKSEESLLQEQGALESTENFAQASAKRNAESSLSTAPITVVTCDRGVTHGNRPPPYRSKLQPGRVNRPLPAIRR